MKLNQWLFSPVLLWLSLLDGNLPQHGSLPWNFLFFLNFFPPGWCHYMEAEDKTQGEKVAEIWREVWRQKRLTGEVESQERGGEGGRREEEVNQRMGTSWKKKIWGSCGAEIATQPHFHSNLILKCTSIVVQVCFYFSVLCSMQAHLTAHCFGHGAAGSVTETPCVTGKVWALVAPVCGMRVNRINQQWMEVELLSCSLRGPTERGILNECEGFGCRDSVGLEL